MSSGDGGGPPLCNRSAEKECNGIDHVLSVVAVTDIATASEWYERLFGKAPTNRPMDSLAE